MTASLERHMQLRGVSDALSMPGRCCSHVVEEQRAAAAVTRAVFLTSGEKLPLRQPPGFRWASSRLRVGLERIDVSSLP
jgi:hypothetical protein